MTVGGWAQAMQVQGWGWDAQVRPEQLGPGEPTGVWLTCCSPVHMGHETGVPEVPRN